MYNCIPVNYLNDADADYTDIDIQGVPWELLKTKTTV